MSNRYLTHFGTILLFHFLLLFGGLNLVQQDVIPRNLTVGPSILKLQVATQVIAPRPLPEKKRPAPSPKVAAPSAPDAKPIKETVPLNESKLSPDAKQDLKTMFKAELRAKIEENKYYPPMSRRLGQTGTVVVAFTLLEDGHIIDVRVDKPSRYDHLNESAMEAVKKVHKFKPIPNELGEAKMDIRVPLKFFTI